MISTIFNDYYGYCVASDNIWAIVGNPSSLRSNPSTASILRTGSVEIYKYNINTDTHDLKSTLYKPISNSELILLSTEANNTGSTGPNDIIHTEISGTIPLTANLDLLIDQNAYFTSSENGFGYSVDVNGTFLAVGCPYFSTTASYSQSFFFSGSGEVDIYDLTVFNIDPYANRIPVSITGYTTSSGFIYVQATVPARQQYSSVLLESIDLTDPNATYQPVNIVNVTNDGGGIVIPTNYININNLGLKATGRVGTDPYLLTISNPHTPVTNSFGYSVSINNKWLAIGSPFESGSIGAVFMYQQLSGSQPSWSFYQTLSTPPLIGVGDQFGRSICLNKATGSYSGSIVVGSNKPSSSHAYVYEFNGINWVLNYTLNPDNTTIYPLTFYPTLPIYSGSYPNTHDFFGYSVGMYKDTIIVGAPQDRDIYEYSGSSGYQQGAVYFFERCPDKNRGYYLARKSYGNEKTLLNNTLGTSVSVYNKYAVAGCPKLFADSASICYLRATIFQQNYCDDETDVVIDGQFILFQQVTGSLPDTSGEDWNIVNVYQVKKRILQPYRDYGYSCNVSDSFIVVGAPFFISGSYRTMDFTAGTGSFAGNLNDIGDLSGKAYIYNLKNLRPNFYVGNVFYRNGKLVIMSSGSAFDGLLLSNNDTSTTYEYDLSFTSKQVIFEKQIVCAVDIGEFNVSTNPTSIVLPTSSFDINNNGIFDFQDCNVILSYMKYKSTEATGNPSTDWSSSIINTATDEEMSVYNMYNQMFGSGSGALFTSSYSVINNSLFTNLDLNQDNRIDINDMNILWKYFINRLTQKNYETYVTPSSKRKFLSQIIDFLNAETMRGIPPTINSNFLDYIRLSQSDPTGSYLAPMVTSIGLYAGADLVAVAKLGSPIKITPDFPMNFIVKMDF